MDRRNGVELDEHLQLVHIACSIQLTFTLLFSSEELPAGNIMSTML